MTTTPRTTTRTLDTPDRGTDASLDTRTEAEKSPADPVSKSVEPEKVVTIEEQGIGPRDPYPTGDPAPAPAPEE